MAANVGEIMAQNVIVRWHDDFCCFNSHGLYILRWGGNESSEIIPRFYLIYGSDGVNVFWMDHRYIDIYICGYRYFSKRHMDVVNDSHPYPIQCDRKGMKWRIRQKMNERKPVIGWMQTMCIMHIWNGIVIKLSIIIYSFSFLLLDRKLKTELSSNYRQKFAMSKRISTTLLPFLSHRSDLR